MIERHVFHGSPREFDAETANPRRQIRETEEGEITFDEVSFHATPHKWIALAYTYTSKKIEGLAEEVKYGMGVNLYSDEKEIAIYGVGSLEESLKQLYGDGGYLYSFDESHFFYKEGLGTQEVITTSPIVPLHIERIDDPVSLLRELGVKFHFIDVSRSE